MEEEEVPYSMVRIYWIDSMTTGGWRRPDDEDITTAKCESIGFLIESTDTFYVLAQSYSCGNGMIGDTITIPLGCVTGFEYLEVER